MKISSQILSVTLFRQGAEVVRRATFELEGGEHELQLEDLTDGLEADTLRVEGRADGALQIGAVDTDRRFVEEADAQSRTELEQKLQARRDELQVIANRLETLEVQKQLMRSLATSPQHLSEESAGKDWAGVYDLIGAKMAVANEGLQGLTADKRRLEEQIETLEQQLADQPGKRKRRTFVTIQANAGQALKAELLLRYQVKRAGWTPLYDLRLETETDEATLEIERRASIWHDSGESWQDIALELSTTRPSGGTSVPKIDSLLLDLASAPQPMQPMARSMPNIAFKAASADAVEMEQAMTTAAAAPMDGGAEMDWMEMEERESEAREGSFQAVFKVPGKISHDGDMARKKVRLSSLRLPVSLEARSAPLFDPTAYLYVALTLEQGPALLPGETALYRDGLYVGKGLMPHVNEGEQVELGFGADDKVQVKRAELAHSKGRHGLIKSENTDERHYQLKVKSHHKRPMPVRLFDRVPVARHDKIKVEILADSSPRDQENVEDRRGVLAFAARVAAGEEQLFNLHYRISWPKGDRLI